MAQIWWGKPVTVETAKIGQRVAISSVDQAAEFMLEEWPSKVKGHAFNVAKSMLLDAFEGKVAPDEARSAFIKALRKSDIYIFED